MNNLFKNNSRFASLADEDGFVKVDNKSKKVKEENKNKDENKKKEENTGSGSNRFKFNDSEKETNAFKKDNNYRDERYRNDRYRRNDFVTRKPEPIIKEEPKPVLLTVDDFSTSLSSIKTEEQKKPIISFSERAALNANKGEVVKAASKSTVTSVWEEKDYSDNRSEQQMAYEVLNSLCNLHERRTAMYIERYGYDAWERTFKFEGWEEEEAYNQKLDDEYERWLEKEEEMELAKYEEMEREEERLANNDRYNNYWKYY